MFRLVPLIFLFFCGLMLAGQVQPGRAGDDGQARSTTMGSSLLTLQGSTRHPTLPNAQIEISAGSAAVVSGSTDSDGRFEIEFNCTDPDGLVVIEVSGTGSQAHVGAARVVHSCAHLQVEAGASGSFQTGPVTPLSTAVYAVLHWTLSDLGLPTQGINYQDLSPFKETLQLFEARRVLGVLPFINNQDIALPSGFDDGLDLARDRPQLVATAGVVEQQVSLERREAVRQALVFSLVNFRNPDPPDNDQFWVRYCPALLFGCPSIYTIAPDLSGQYGLSRDGGPASFFFRARDDFVHQDSMQAIPDNLRAIRVERQDGAPLQSFFSAVIIDGQQVASFTDWLWQDLRLTDASELIELIAITEKRVRRFPNNPEIPEEVFEPTGMNFSSGFTDQSVLPEWEPPANGESRMLLFYFGETTLERLIHWGADRVTFSDDGSAFAHRQDISLQWSLSDGRLILTADDIDSHEYQLLGGSLVDQGHQHVMVWVRSESELVATLDTSTIQAEGPDEFVETDIPGRYVSGIDLDRLVPLGVDPYPATFLVFNLEEGGDGWWSRLEQVDEPNPAQTNPIDWHLNERGEIVLRIEFGTDVVSWRSWTPVATVGNDHQYVLEVGPTSIFGDPDYEIPFVPGRLNFYRKVEVPEP